MIDLLAKKRVFVGMIYLVLIVLLCQPQTTIWWLGIAVALFGEGIRTWASGYIFKNENLAQLGPFSVGRNPLYFGSFFLGLGLTLMSGNRWLILIYPFLFLPVYLRKIEMEERELLQRFGDTAVAYFERVPRFFPNPSLYQAAANNWNLHRVVFIHKEWTNWFLLAAVSGYFYFILRSGSML